MENSHVKPSFLFCLRAILLAFDRRRLLGKAFGKATRGEIVICDRYPTRVIGAIDSPMILPDLCETPLYKMMQRIESRIYDSIPKADLIIITSVPLEIALHRNQKREKPEGSEPESFVRARHSMINESLYQGTKKVIVNTNKSISATILDVKQEIWNILS